MPRFTQRIPTDDTRSRAVCDQCGFVDYANPKVVVGAVVTEAGQVLLCRRAIEPRRGFWTIPAGYLELDETVEEGALRETYEEAEARIMLDGILAIYSISRIGQVQVIFRARFDGTPAFRPGVESLDTRMFAAADIPWDELAFPSVNWALQAWQRAGDRPLAAPAGNPPGDHRGVSPELVA
ncbi:MAG: NUDIX hydrolase [Gemmatimonadaceae bacterium]|nr:NUDIX hydrolase [Acetobacteraceae bacterium]